jgi:hypothetical protein
MAVPDTSTFGLIDVINELELWELNEDLVACFTYAVSNKFDSTYNPNSDGTNNNLY